MAERPQKQIVREIQMELFSIETALSEFETKRKELKAQLVQLGVGTKVCTKCGDEMDIEQFYRDGQKLDKRTSRCCECMQKAERERNARRREAA